MGFKLTYNEIGNFQFQKAIQKLNSSVTDQLTAYKIRKITSKLKSYRAQIAEEYTKELAEKYAKRNEQGKYDAQNWTPEEGKQEEFMKAQEEFGKKEIFIDRLPLTFNEMKDIKMSAEEQEALGAMFDDAHAEEFEMQKAQKVLKSV